MHTTVRVQIELFTVSDALLLIIIIIIIIFGGGGGGGGGGKRICMGKVKSLIQSKLGVIQFLNIL